MCQENKALQALPGFISRHCSQLTVASLAGPHPPFEQNCTKTEKVPLTARLGIV